jgi:hypothetical protein
LQPSDEAGNGKARKCITRFQTFSIFYMLDYIDLKLIQVYQIKS